MNEIVMPHLDCLVTKHDGKYVSNAHSGSMGTQADHGVVCARTFNYRFYADLSGGEWEKFIIVAEAFVRLPWSEGGTQTAPEQMRFPCTPEGLAEAEVWLNQKAAENGF
jgi:hypothetical protein